MGTGAIKNWGWLVALLLTPIVLWLLPGDYFDNSGLIVCPSRLFFNIECLGCGMTRAVMHFHHLQFDEAVFFNTGVLFVYPVLAMIWMRWTWDALGKVRKSQSPIVQESQSPRVQESQSPKVQE